MRVVKNLVPITEATISKQDYNFNAQGHNMFVLSLSETTLFPTETVGLS